MNRRDEIKKIVYDSLFQRTSVGDKIEISRGRRVDVEDMPCISIYTTKESSKLLQQSPQLYLLTATVELVVFAKMDEFSEETLDKITGEIEDNLLLLNIPELIEGGKDIVLGDTDIGIFGGDSRDIIPSATISFDVSYEREVCECEVDNTVSVSTVNNVKNLY